MKLKEKLAFNYAETEFNMYGPNGEGSVAEKAYLTGFEKAREMAVNYIKEYETNGSSMGLEDLGEEDIKDEA